MENNRVNEWVKMEINHLTDLHDHEFEGLYANGLKLKEHHRKPRPELSSVE